MKAKRFLSFFVILAVLASFTAISAYAADEPQGKYELTATFKSNKKQIAHRWYESMDELWNNLGPVASSDRYTEIKLYANWDISEEKELSHYRCDVTLDLNGHNIIRHTDNNKQVKNGDIFRISSNAHLTITDSDPDSEGYDGIKGGVITGGASTNGGGAFTVTDNAKLTIAGGTIYKCTTNEYGGAVMLKGSSEKHPSLDMKDSRIYFCQTTGALSNCHGGAIYADKADVTISDAQFDSCYSEDNGGAIYMNSGSLNIKNSKFVSNHCLDYGGAIFISGGSLRISFGRFSSNEAKKDGGALYVDADDGSRIRDSVFNKNKSYGNGGAIYVNDIGAFLIDTDVIANSAAGYGGGIYVDSRYDIGVKGLVRIYNNSGKDERNNLTLQDGFATRAYLSDGGLYEGSKIGLSSTSLNVKYADDISVYQEEYFFPEQGYLTRYHPYQREAPVYSSVFSNGGYTWLVIGIVLLVLCGAVTYTVLTKKKKKKTKEE